MRSRRLERQSGQTGPRVQKNTTKKKKTRGLSERVSFTVGTDLSRACVNNNQKKT